MSEIKQKKIGLFGGTFDPIHLGHLSAAQEIEHILDLDKIYFIPSGNPPHKENANITPAQDRLEMIKLAIEENPDFEVSEFELNSKSPSYTIKTLEHFSTIEPDVEFYFIVGHELFNNIESWKDYKKLFELSNFAVITRPGYSDMDSSKVPLALEDDFRYYNVIENVISYTNTKDSTLKNKNIVFIEIKGIEISSTEIRSFVKSKQSIKHLVPRSVEEYISAQKLYTQEATQ